MKKTIVTLMGLFMLVSCSEEAFQGMEDQSDNHEIPMGTNSFNDGIPGYFVPGGGTNHAGVNYVSPWDIWLRTGSIFRPHYTFINAGDGGTSPYIMRVRPVIGLAYYDGVENGWFTDVFTNIPIANLANGNYPNLYASGFEAGNMIIGEPLDMLGDGTPGENEASVGGVTDYLPLDLSTLGSASNPMNKRFRIISPTTTQQEYNLLTQYGKVFYYHVELIDRVTNAVVFGTDIQLENEPLDALNDPLWRFLYPGKVPTNPSSVDIHYYESASGSGTQWPGAANINLPPLTPNWECDSREVVFKKFAEYKIDVSNATGGAVPGFLTLEMVQGDHLWENASMTLRYSLF